MQSYHSHIAFFLCLCGYSICTYIAIVMAAVYVKLLRVILVVVILSVIYTSFMCLKLPEGTFTVTSNVYSVKSCDQVYLLENNPRLSNSTSNNFRHPKQSSINVYFTVKTTPGNYEKRIRPLQMSWFQKVSKEMVSW